MFFCLFVCLFVCFLFFCSSEKCNRHQHFTFNFNFNFILFFNSHRPFRDYTPELELEFAAYKISVVSGGDLGFGSLMSRLEAALSVDAYDNEAVIKKCSNSSIRRKESKIRRAKRREEDGTGLLLGSVIRTRTGSGRGVAEEVFLSGEENEEDSIIKNENVL